MFTGNEKWQRNPGKDLYSLFGCLRQFRGKESRQTLHEKVRILVIVLVFLVLDWVGSGKRGQSFLLRWTKVVQPGTREQNFGVCQRSTNVQCHFLQKWCLLDLFFFSSIFCTVRESDLSRRKRDSDLHEY